MCNISHICHSYIFDMCRCLSDFHCIDAQKKLLIASPSLNIPMAFYFKHILCIVNMDGELFAKSFGVGPFSIFYLLFPRIFTFRLQCYIFIVCIEGTSVSNSMRFVWSHLCEHFDEWQWLTEWTILFEKKKMETNS